MNRKGRISHERIEALEKEVATLKQHLAEVEAHPALSIPVLRPAQPGTEYIAQFDRWPGNER